MESQIVNEIANILNGTFAKNETVLLHEVIWTIDAKHHLIANLDELNSAIKLVGSVQKSYLNSEVKLSRSDGNESDYLIQDDIEKAMVVYNERLNP
jgi:chemotaxis protein CheY-P-specific phosphatase CheC